MSTSTQSKEAAAEFRLPRRILAPVDFVGDGAEMLRGVLARAEVFGARVSLLHVLDSIGSREEEERRARAGLTEIAEELGGSVEASVRSGSAALEICEAAREGGANLIVLAAHEHHDLKHTFLGGTSEAVVRHAPCPVLVLRDGAPVVTAWRRILVPVDFSAVGEKAIRYATGLAECFGGTVSLVHVLDTQDLDDAMAFSGGDAEQIGADVSARLASMMGRLVPEKLRGMIYVKRGVPFAQIAAVAAMHETELVVLTTHGRTGLAHLLMGSTAERVMKHLAAPVLVLGRG
jgi:nucleotide-binding universal stress UspA family protein